MKRIVLVLAVLALVAGAGVWWFLNQRQAGEQVGGAPAAEAAPADPIAERLKGDLADWVPAGALTMVYRNSRTAYDSSRLGALMKTPDMTSLWHQASVLLADPEKAKLPKVDEDAFKAADAMKMVQTNRLVLACVEEMVAGRFDFAWVMSDQGLRTLGDSVVERSRSESAATRAELPKLEGWLCVLRIPDAPLQKAFEDVVAGDPMATNARFTVEGRTFEGFTLQDTNRQISVRVVFPHGALMLMGTEDMIAPVLGASEPEARLTSMRVRQAFHEVVPEPLALEVAMDWSALEPGLKELAKQPGSNPALVEVVLKMKSFGGIGFTQDGRMRESGLLLIDEAGVKLLGYTAAPLTHLGFCLFNPRTFLAVSSSMDAGSQTDQIVQALEAGLEDAAMDPAAQMQARDSLEKQKPALQHVAKLGPEVGMVVDVPAGLGFPEIAVASQAPEGWLNEAIALMEVSAEEVKLEETTLRQKPAWTFVTQSPFFAPVLTQRGPWTFGFSAAATGERLFADLSPTPRFPEATPLAGWAQQTNVVQLSVLDPSLVYRTVSMFFPQYVEPLEDETLALINPVASVVTREPEGLMWRTEANVTGVPLAALGLIGGALKAIEVFGEGGFDGLMGGGSGEEPMPEDLLPEPIQDEDPDVEGEGLGEE